MIDHISLRVRNVDKALTFYKAALRPLGYEVLMEFPEAVGLGADHKADFWIHKSANANGGNPTHIAFSADRKTVDAFHAAAIAAGGQDHGAPGPRTEYHPHYYGAFVLDPEGNNVEAVCHAPAGAKKAGAAATKKTKKTAGKKTVRSGKSATKSKTAAKPKAKAAAKAKPKAKAAAKAKPKAKAAAKAKPKAAVKAKAKPKAKAAAKAKPKAAAKGRAAAKAKPKAAAKAKPKAAGKAKAKPKAAAKRRKG